LTTVLAFALALILFPFASHAQCVFHVSTAQQLQNALTQAGSNGCNNTIYITNGYYTGNFNYSSITSNSLTIENEPAVTNNLQIDIDGSGGRAMYLASTGIGTITVQGITFIRNCGSTSKGALEIAAGANASVFVQNCEFLSPTNTSGIGLELDSGFSATITNCIVAGATNSGTSIGILVTGVSGTVNLLNCVVVTNNGGGFTCSGSASLTGNLFIGNSGSGGFSCSGSATLTGNLFVGNAGSSGAYVAGAATIVGNTFTGNSGFANSANGSGGGGLMCAGSATLVQNTFTSNSSTYGGYCCGGGAFCFGPASVIGNTFIGNFAVAEGGGLICESTATLTGNSFISNSCPYGGGLYAAGVVHSILTNLTISSNVFIQNVASAGGGLYITGPTLTLQDNLIANNSQTNASSQGGGVWVDATSNLFMINNTITGNTAAGSGGGAAFEVTGTVELLNVYNNIIWGNSAGNGGGDVWLTGTGQSKVFEFNDANSMSGLWNITTNNIDLAPQFFNQVAGDYHIQSTSPCRGMGTTNAPSLPGFDLDGNPRVINGLVDIGCYEFTTNVFHPADTNLAWTITPAEFNAYAAAWKSGQNWTNPPNPIPANYVTRAGYLMTNGEAYYYDGSARPTGWKP
jgi:hypothetical protein